MFETNLELLAEKNKDEMRPKFQDTEKYIKKRRYTIFSILNERGSFSKSKARKYKGERIEEDEETGASTHLLRIQKNELIDLMQHLERHQYSTSIWTQQWSV